MLLEAGRRNETGTTDFTFVFVLDVVPFLMRNQAFSVHGDVAAGLACVALDVRLVFQLVFLQRGDRVEAAAAVLADELVVLQVNLARFVYFQVHGEIFVGDETVAAKVALYDTVGDDQFCVLYFGHVHTICDEQLLCVFLFEYLVRVALLLILR